MPPSARWATIDGSLLSAITLALGLALGGWFIGRAGATANAREAAQQFAADSRTALGGIRQASQGCL
jgi:hypothetical protein